VHFLVKRNFDVIKIHGATIKNTQMSNFIGNLGGPCGRTDRQTDMTKLPVTLSKFAKANNNHGNGFGADGSEVGKLTKSIRK